MSSAELDEDEVKREFSEGEGGERSQKGGFRFTDLDEIKKQRKAIWDFVKKIGIQALQGVDLTRVSLPVRIFEPRSFLERLTDNWSYTTTYLRQASEHMDDPVEVMKNVVVFALSGLHCTCKAKKPFNPILGETYEAYYEDGTTIMCEQTEHHPPISHYEVVGPEEKFKLFGFASWKASVRGNSVKGQQTGTVYLKFRNGTMITYSPPYLWMTGIMWGSRVLDYCGKMHFHDHKNMIKCDVQFNPDAQGFLRSWFRSPKTPSDWLRGEIYKELPSPDGKVVRMTLATLEGSWLSHIDMKESGSEEVVCMWNIDDVLVDKPIPTENPLPSDCRFREDIQALADGDVEEAQKWKVVLEDKQRVERRLRGELTGKEKKK